MKTWLLPLLTVAAVAFSYALFAAYALSQSGAIEYEGPCLWAAHRIKCGLNPYPLESLESSPFAVIIYPPLYFVLSSLVTSVQDPHYQPMRLLSMLATCGTAVFYYLYLRGATSRAAALGGSTLLMSFMAIWLWSAKARVDALSLCLTACALWLYSRSRLDKTLSSDSMPAAMSLARSIASPATLALATLTKQPSALVAPACVLDMLFERRFKKAVVYASAFALVLAGAIAVAQYATAGGFIAHMRFASHMPFAWQFLSDRLALMAIDLPKCLLAVVALTVITLNQSLRAVLDAKKIALLRLSGLILLTTLPVTFYTAGTAYSNVNHFLIPLLALPSITAVVYDCASSESARPSIQARLYRFCYNSTLLLSGLLLLFIANGRFGSGNQAALRLEKPVAPETLAAILKGGKILSEDGGYAPIYGATSEPVDITTFIQVLGRDGKQAEIMLKKLDNREYAAAIINHQEIDGTRPMKQWSDRLIQTLKRRYNHLGQVNGNGEVQDVYVPAIIKDHPRESL